MMATETSTIDKLDLVWGGAAIAAEVGLNARQVFHLVNSGHLPIVKKVGGKLCADRGALRAFFLSGEAA